MVYMPSPLNLLGNSRVGQENEEQPKGWGGRR
jgi:hypothetical protein